MPYKITLIGGGSSTFTPLLMKLFVESDVLKGSTIALMDIDAHRLDVMDKLAKQIVAKAGSDLKIESSTDRRASVTDADFVIPAISVGGFDAWEHDIEIPAKYGIYMPICDSIGPGGIMRAFRHIPPLVELCEDLEEVAPEAWVFNYSNPATANALAMLTSTDIKVVSLCSCSSAVRAPFNGKGLKPEDMILPAPAVGLNHCAGIPELRMKDGSSALQLVYEKTDSTIAKYMLETYGIMPYCDGHWAEFFPFLCQLEEPYKGKLQGLKMKHGMTVHSMEHERARAAKWERLAAKWTSGDGEEVSLDVLPGGEAIEVVAIIESLIENRNQVFVVNVPNQGAIENLPDDAVVEISAMAGGYGIQPLFMGPVPDAYAAHLRLHIAGQELTVEAALTGDRDVALQAFMNDPQISSKLEPEAAEHLMEELLDVHADYLPQFAD
jgi:alpha-galactosidase